MLTENPTKGGGFEVRSDCRWAKYHARWGADGTLIESQCQIKPPCDEVPTPAPSDSNKPCSGCDKPKVSIVQVLRGALGITKAQLGIDPATAETIFSRKSVCLACEHYEFGTCVKCSCWLSKKVLIDSESCPVGKW